MTARMILGRGPPCSLGLLKAEAALRENSAPKLEGAATCLPHQTVRKLQGLLVESPSNFVVLVDDDGGKVLGIVTLHDLLRAEVEKAGSGDLRTSSGASRAASAKGTVSA